MSRKFSSQSVYFDENFLDEYFVDEYFVVINSDTDKNIAVFTPVF